jgi:hypothetical protein
MSLGLFILSLKFLFFGYNLEIIKCDFIFKKIIFEYFIFGIIGGKIEFDISLPILF